jgi:hypothetical protein
MTLTGIVEIHLAIVRHVIIEIIKTFGWSIRIIQENTKSKSKKNAAVSPSYMASEKFIKQRCLILTLLFSNHPVV